MLMYVCVSVQGTALRSSIPLTHTHPHAPTCTHMHTHTHTYAHAHMLMHICIYMAS
jgi:hypothetical protein